MKYSRISGKPVCRECMREMSAEELMDLAGEEYEIAGEE